MNRFKALIVGQVLTAVVFQSGCASKDKDAGDHPEDRKEVTGSPSAYSVSPKEGPRKGGFLIRILGSNISKHAQITVGGKPCDSPQIDEGTGAAFCKVQSFDVAQKSDIVITNPGGESYTYSLAIEFTKNPDEVEKELKTKQDRLKHEAEKIEAEKQQKLLEIEKKYAQQTEELKKKHLDKLAAERESERLKAERDKAAQDAIAAEKERQRLLSIEQEKIRVEQARERDRLTAEHRRLLDEQYRLDQLERQIQTRRAETQRLDGLRQTAAQETVRLRLTLHADQVQLAQARSDLEQAQANRTAAERQQTAQLVAANQAQAAAVQGLEVQVAEAERAREAGLQVAQHQVNERVRLSAEVSRLQRQAQGRQAELTGLEQRVVVLTNEIDSNQSELDELLAAERQRAGIANPQAVPAPVQPQQGNPPQLHPPVAQLQAPAQAQAQVVQHAPRTRQEVSERLREVTALRNQAIEHVRQLMEQGNDHLNAVEAARLDAARNDVLQLSQAIDAEQAQMDLFHEADRRAEQQAANQAVNRPVYARTAPTSCAGLELTLTQAQLAHHRENPEDQERILHASCAELKAKLDQNIRTNLGSATEHYQKALLSMRRSQRENAGSIAFGGHQYQVNPDFLTVGDPYLHLQQDERSVQIGVGAVQADPLRANGVEQEMFAALRRFEAADDLNQLRWVSIARMLLENLPLRLRFVRAAHSVPVNYSSEKLFRVFRPAFAAVSASHLENEISRLEDRFAFKSPQLKSFGDFISRNLRVYKESLLERYAEGYRDVGIQIQATVAPGLKRTMGLSFGLLHPIDDLVNPIYFPLSNPTSAPQDDRRVYLSPLYVAETLLRGGRFHEVQLNALSPSRMVWLMRMAADKHYRQGIAGEEAELLAAKPYLTELTQEFLRRQLEEHSFFAEQNPEFAAAIRRDFASGAPSHYFQVGVGQNKIATEAFWTEMLIHYGYLVEVRAR